MIDIYYAIEKQRLIDIHLFDYKVNYTCLCLSATKKIVTIINFNYRQKTFDGFTIFRNKDFHTYGVWKKQYIKVKTNNLSSFLDLYNIHKLKTFNAWFKELMRRRCFVAIFFDDDLETYIVAVILEVTPTKIKIKRISEAGEWFRSSYLDISRINYFSFGTKYVLKLEKKYLP